MLKKILSLSAIVASSLLSTAAMAEMTVTSKDIPANSTLTNKQVFDGFGCSGDNISPQLSWSKGPVGTKSYAINVYDPDAPTGSGWWHWVVFNIPANVTSIDTGASVNTELLPEGAVQSRTDFGVPGFGGACPPEGDKPHRYIFTVYALNAESLPLSVDSSAAMVGFMINGTMLDKGSFTATYGR